MAPASGAGHGAGADGLDHQGRRRRRSSPGRPGRAGRARRLLRSVIPAEPFGTRLDQLAALLCDMAAAGLPGGHVMDLEDDAIALYEALDAVGRLRLRLAPWRRAGGLS